jgi:hypothetical protein
VIAASASLVPFAGDFSGGVLVLDLANGEPERAPVVQFGSEGDITVLGESFDDFLALLVAEEPDPMEDCWAAAGDVRAWILGSGVAPYPDAHARLVTLAEHTRQFWIAWTEALHVASRRLRPAEAVEHRLVLGERIGDVAIGMPRATLDERWGPPEMPEWARTSTEVGAFYARAPVSVRLDRAAQRVIAVTLHAGRHRAVTDDGVAPLLMRAADASTWLASLGLAGETSRLAIQAPTQKTSLLLDGARGATDELRWVSGIEIFDPGA